MPREVLAPEAIRSTPQLRAAYAGAFDLYASRPSETALHMAYELGRRAVELAVSVPELGRIHHQALRAVLRESTFGDEDVVVSRGADFLAECLCAFEMIRRGYNEAHEHARLEHRNATVLRGLSMLLADASLALDRRSSLTETLHLVAEAARELTGAQWCSATVSASLTNGGPMTVHSGERADGERGHELVAELTELSGRRVGSLRLFGDNERGFRAMDQAVLTQLAQMTAAAIERTRLYS